MEGLPIYQGPRAFGIIYRKAKWQFQFESMSEPVERAQERTRRLGN